MASEAKKGYRLFGLKSCLLRLHTKFEYFNSQTEKLRLASMASEVVEASFTERLQHYLK